MTKKQEINLNEIDTDFVISSFKNKERRNNPSSIPRALVTEHEKTAEENTEKTEATATPLSKKQMLHPESTNASRANHAITNHYFLLMRIPLRNGKLVSIREKYTTVLPRLFRLSPKMRFRYSAISTMCYNIILKCFG